MKNLFLLICSLYLISNTQAQNLVPNPSFETITSCPHGDNYIYRAQPWFQPSYWHGNVINSSSSDLYNACAGTAFTVGVPINGGGGFQYARTGVGYAGIFTHSDTNNYREYIEVPLIDTLIANHSYCVEFYVSLNINNVFGMAISNIGAYFSFDSLLDASNLHTIDYILPQVENQSGNILNDTLNWMMISGNYIAIGGEKYMTLGNFHLPINTNTQLFNPSATNSTTSYYFIDDVSVVDCGGVGVEEVSKETDIFKLYPNPNNGNMTMEYNVSENTSPTLIIYDITGRIVKQYELNSHNLVLTINASDLNAGVYYYDIKTSEIVVKSDKLVIVKSNN